MNVQFDFKITDKMHTLYNSYFKCPPKGVVYEKANFKIINKKNFSFFKKIYNQITKITGNLNFKFEERIIDTLRNDSGFDLVHFANHLGKTKIPFVADYEDLTSFLGGMCDTNKKSDAEKLLSQKSLKCLLPMNSAVLNSFNNFFKEISPKIKQEILYPVAFIPEEQKKRTKKEKIVLFAGSGNILNQGGIYNKGSYEVLIAFEKLSKMFPDWNFIFLGKTPNESKFKTSKNFLVRDPVPQKELWDIMRKSLIFVQTSYITPAMAFVEAMNFRLPIITYDSYANKDYVDSKNGILINPEKTPLFDVFNHGKLSEEVYQKMRENGEKNAKSIIKAVSKLIKNEKIRMKMGEESLRRVTTGKFSVKKKNDKLLKIYKEAIK